MVDSASDTSVSDELREHQRIWAQGDLVSKGFRRLAEKYGRGGDPDRTTIEHTLSTRSVEESLPEINPEYTFDPWKWWNVESTLDAIDLTIQCITGSELDVAQLDWPSYLDDVDHVLHKVVTVINQCTHEVPRKTFVQEPVFHLAKLGIGLIKIAKLFFKKLSIDRSLNARRIPLRLPLFTEMCSKRIESLAQSLPLVTADILQLGNLFETVYDAHENRSGRDFVKVATSLKSRFQAPLVVLLHYLIPSISDTYGSSTQDYYKNWFVTWNTQFILTTENFISAAKSLDNNPP
ncbi:hypothetical protein PtA15_1A509 [Puccinia triticina]|uniref:Uncharacterized protein n=1 Tax=Puccinia triticina TaxID=208348 RepID=A0ABY7CBB6_9BASI|nr:uncharacterized protein PtA15_1A509 [Puccinia triticina]WAQ81170.1 hypothetical protein PtA15_1A509 [Puccinia triticina]